MTQAEKKIIRELLIQATRQVRNHGHGCGYGSFPSKSKNNQCPYCTPTAQAIRETRKILKGRVA